MSKAEIIEELAHLSPEDLAEVKAWLDRVAPDKTIAKADQRGPSNARIRTPRLANRAQSADFTKLVTI